MDMGICVWGACICTCAEARKRHWSSSVAWYVGAEIWTRDCAASNLNHRAISWAPRDLKVILWLFIIFIIILTNLLQGLNCVNYLKLNIGAATEKDKYFFLCDCESDMYKRWTDTRIMSYEGIHQLLLWGPRLSRYPEILSTSTVGGFLVVG